LVARLEPLPWIPTDAQWRAVLEVTAGESLRNRLMLALAFDAALRREELELHEPDRPRPIRRLTPTRQHIGKRFGHPALAGAERRERPQRRDVTIPRRRRAPAPRPAQDGQGVA
jgi:hypothetical protein